MQTEKEASDDKGGGAVGVGGWAGKLYPYIQHPEQHTDSVLYFDDEMVAIHDKYPKVSCVCGLCVCFFFFIFFCLFQFVLILFVVFFSFL
jgi:hypothetical protein